jgi:FtsZ-binding cell division protein ZapB
MDTFDELRGKILLQVDTIELIEMLQVSSEEILDRFEDKVMQYQDKLEEYVNDEPA